MILIDLSMASSSTLWPCGKKAGFGDFRMSRYRPTFVIFRGGAWIALSGGYILIFFHF